MKKTDKRLARQMVGLLLLLAASSWCAAQEQKTPAPSEPQNESNSPTQSTPPINTRIMPPPPPREIGPAEERDMRARAVTLAACLEAKTCPELIKLVNVPDNHIFFRTRRDPRTIEMWLPWPGVENKGNWKKFLLAHGVPTPKDNTPQDRIFITFSNEGLASGPKVESISTSTLPVVMYHFDRASYTFQQVDGMPYVTISGRDFLDDWEKILLDPKTKKLIDPTKWTRFTEWNCEDWRRRGEGTVCEEHNRAHIELVARLADDAEGSSKLAFLLNGFHAKHYEERNGEQIGKIHACLYGDPPIEQFEAYFRGGFYDSPQTFIKVLVDRGVPQAEAEHKAASLMPEAEENAKEFLRVYHQLLEEGESNRDANDRAVNAILKRTFSEVAPEAAKNPSVIACVNLIHDYEEAALIARLKAGKAMNTNLVPGDLAGYLDVGEEPLHAVKRYIPSLLRKQYGMGKDKNGNLVEKAPGRITFFIHLWEKRR